MGDILLAPYEDIVRNSAQKVVAFACGNDGSKSIFQVIATSGIKVHAVCVEPGTPECTAQPVDMSVKGTANVISGGDINDTLNFSMD
jgi:hypothetical protein